MNFTCTWSQVYVKAHLTGILKHFGGRKKECRNLHNGREKYRLKSMEESYFSVHCVSKLTTKSVIGNK